MAVFSLGLSLFIEIAQLTGLFFLFNGSYRLCDIDDVITNTLDGVIGFEAARLLERVFPQLEAFDKKIGTSYGVKVAR